MPDIQITELALSRIWQAGRFAQELRTVDGARLHVVYPGVWTHSNGPDFRDALIDLAGSLTRGSVELHLRSSDWRRHGHDTNPAYDEVILHVVLDDDGHAPLEQPPGRPIPTLELRNYLTSGAPGTHGDTGNATLGSLGQHTCLPTLADKHPALVHAALRHAGWSRFTTKQLRFSQEFERLPPADVLYHGLLDGLGLLQNRAGMAQVADRLPLATLEQASGPDADAVLALLLGVGGFLPLSPVEAQLAELDPAAADRVAARFQPLANAAGVSPLPVSIWNLNRVRPQNHPVRRLASLASLLRAAYPAGILDACLNVDTATPDPWRPWIDSATPAIGTSRAAQLATNVLAPFVAAYAQATGNLALSERIGAIWERLPGRADDSIARATLTQIVGQQRFPIKLAVEAQGLHHIGRHGCQHLRCFECPIAFLAMTHERPGL